MTTKPRKSRHRTGLLKSTVLAGGLLATVLGTTILAQNDATVAAEELPEEIAVYEPYVPQKVVSDLLAVERFSSEPYSSEPYSSEPLGIIATWQPTLAPIPTVAGSAVSTASLTLSNPATVSTAAVAAPTIELPPLPNIEAVSAANIANVGTSNLGNVLSYELREIPSVQIPPPPPRPATKSRSSK